MHEVPKFNKIRGTITPSRNFKRLF